MLDYDDLESLERYALAAGTEERQKLLAAGVTAVTPGQAFLAGLFALEQGDLAAANEQLASLGPGAHYQRLEALIALRSWSTNPTVTRTYLERTCGLNFHAPAPAADVAQPEGPSEPHLPGDPDAEGAAAAAPRLSSSLDPSLYSDQAFLRKAIRQTRGPLAPPMRLARPQTAPEPTGDLTALLSPAGQVAALAYDEEFGLGLTFEERLKLVGAGCNDGRPKLAFHAQALAGSPFLTALAKEALEAQRGAAFESLLPYMTAEQLERLVSELPPEVAASRAVLFTAVRKMYGTNGAVAGAAAAVDALSATTATSHPTPYITALEAAAIQRRVLEMCEKIQRTAESAGAEGVSEQLLCLMARALLPLTKAAVRSAVDASVAAEAADPGGAVHEAVLRETAEAAGLLSRLVRTMSALSLLSEPGARGHDMVFQQCTAGRRNLWSQMGLLDLGPALPELSSKMQPVLLRLMKTVLHISPDPLALFAPGGVMVGTLNPAGQARLLAEVMLTRGSQPAPDGPRIDWVAAYRDAGGDPAQLAESVELELSGPGAEDEYNGEVVSGRGSVDDDLALLVTHKGVRHIAVLVYDIATESLYRETGREVDMGIDLEGLGATFQMDIALPAGLPALQRCCRRVPLPQLKGRRGVWVVEVQGGGRHSRALIRRGSLAAVVRPSPAGLAMTLFREDGSSVEDPRVCVDGRVYGSSAATGEVLVPYRAGGAVNVPAVLVDGAGGFASLMTLRHLTEKYRLQCGMHFEPESAAAGGRAGLAPLLLQLNLSIGGWTAPLELLQDVVLTVEVDDLEGGGGGGGSTTGARRQVFQDWSPGDGLRAAVVQVRLPDRPGSVTASLTGRIKLVAPGSDGEAAYQSFSERRTWQLNNSGREPDALRDLYLTRAQNGHYLLRLLGRAGEPHPGVPVVVALSHVFSASEILEPNQTDSAPPAPLGDAPPETDDDDGGNGDGTCALAVKRTLVTDADGTIDLGHLAGIAAVAAGVEGSVAVSPYGRGASHAKLRRRYRWRLPCGLSGAVPTGDRESHGAGAGDGDGLFQTDLLLRAPASAGNGVQCRIPCTALAGRTVEAAGAAGDLRLRLGLVLVAVAPSPLLSTNSTEQGGPGSWKIAQLMDEKHVAVREGGLEVHGLGPGVYRLFATRFNLAATVLVYKGPVITPTALKAGGTCDGGFVMFGGMVAPLSEAKPLQVTEFSVSAAGGVTARLQGSPSQLSAATVHVILTRFEPHFGLGRLHWGPEALGCRLLSAGPGTAFGEPRTGGYQSGRQLGDEVRYVLERRRLVAEGRVRPTPALVERPSLLVQPCKVRETDTHVQVARRGEEFEALAATAAAGSRRCAAMMCGNALEDVRIGAACAAPAYGLYAARVEAKDVSSLGLDFCPPAVILPNVPVGPDGVIQLSPEQLSAAVGAVAGPAGLRLSASDPWVAAGHRVARLIAYTAPAGVPSDAVGALSYCEARVAVEGVTHPSWSDPRLLTALQRPFPAGSGCVEQRNCHRLQPGSDLVIADAATAKLQLYGTVSKIWALYGSLLSLAPYSPAVPYSDGSGAATWAEFTCVGSWSTLSSAAKVQRFSQLACRELAFFCYCHDPDFFRAVVLPYLRARLPSSRCCLDAWLAGVRGRQLVDVWAAPHLYGTLTPLERILLAWEEDLVAGSEAALVSSLSSPAAPGVLPRLARLGADMRARLRRQVVRVGGAAVADANRRRFEIALNGPGQGEEDRGPDADMCGAAESSFWDGQAEQVSEPPSAPGIAVTAAMPPPRMGMLGAAAPMRLSGRQRGNFAVMANDMEARQMQAAAPAYRAPQATQEWAEAGWFRRAPTERPDPNIISQESEFWADLAEHLSEGGRLGPQHPASSEAVAAVTSAGGGSPAPTGAAFLPRHLETAGWTFSDALLATAVVGVSFEEVAPLSVTNGTRMTLTAVVPTVAYVRQTAALSEAGPGGAQAAGTVAGGGAAAAAASAGPDAVQRSSSVLLLQRLLDPGLDPSELPKQRSCAEDGEEDDDEESKMQQNADGVEVPYGSPLSCGRQYCYSVTITNTGPAAVHLDVTIQAPEGAVPLGGCPALWVCTTEIQPYGARKLPLYYFYFPKPAPASVAAPGVEYGTFPAVAARRGRIVALALGQSSRLKVVPSLPAPPALDLSTDLSGGWGWTRLAALPATPEADAARLRYLAEGDLSAANLSLVLWRCRDASFWQQAVAALQQRRVWDEQIWSYAVLHRNEEAMKELLPSLATLKDILGPEAPAAGPLFGRSGTEASGTADGAGASVFDPDRPPHLEYWPLVNARAHPLGDKRVVLNDAVDASWRQLLRRLAALAAGGREASTEDLLAAAYLLVIQDRLVEASDILARVETRGKARPPSATSAAAACSQDLQLCYLRAWLVLADPVASAADLRAAAASVRQWCQVGAAAAVTSEGPAAAAEAALPYKVVEPKWQSRLGAMVAALDETAAIAEGGAAAAAAGSSSSSAAAAGGSGGGGAGSVVKTEPVLLLYDSPDGPRGAVVLETTGVQKVVLNTRQMDLELLFSASPFDTTLASVSRAAAVAPAASGRGARRGGAGQGKFAFLRPSWTATLDLQAIAAGTRGPCEGLAPGAIRLLPNSSNSTGGGQCKLLIQPHLLVQALPAVGSGAAGSEGAGGVAQGASSGSGAMLLEALSAGDAASSGGRAVTAGHLRATLACYSCGFKAVVLREKGVVLVTGADDGVPVASAYVKAYVKYVKDYVSDKKEPGFHKDGYTDRRGLLDFWALTSKPVAKVRKVALFISHPVLGNTVLHTEPPLH